MPMVMEDHQDADNEDNSDYETISEESMKDEEQGNGKYTLNSNLLNIDHGPNPQFDEKRLLS